MAASGSLAGGTGSWALLWAAVQACHMVRLAQAGQASRALQLLPQAPKDNCSALGREPSGRRAPRGSTDLGGLEKTGCSQTLCVSFAYICILALTPEASPDWSSECWG